MLNVREISTSNFAYRSFKFWGARIPAFWTYTVDREDVGGYGRVIQSTQLMFLNYARVGKGEPGIHRLPP